ncbi:response regulator [Magnetococcales bacterium HHB-1]
MMTTAQKKATILIVDDVPSNIRPLVSFLGKKYALLIAKSGPAALETALNKPVDLILLDIVMPEMDGFEVLEKLKANPKTADIPIIFLTGKNDIDDEAKGLLMGASDYIFKPANPTIVTTRVETQLICHKHSFLIEQKVQERTAHLAEELKKARAEIAQLRTQHHQIDQKDQP